MEASFLTSNSFTKTIKVFPTARAKGVISPKKNPDQFQGNNVKKQPKFRCCLDSNSLPEEGNPPAYIDKDWRAFRARLVAGERASQQPVPSSLVDLDTVVDLLAPITLGTKWAHTIPEPEKGSLLIATEKLDGVHIFERAVILLLSTGPIGPFGIIINRPSLMSIKESKSAMMDLSGTFCNKPLYFGGPIEDGVFLVNPEGSDDGVARSGVFDKVMKGVYYGTKESVGCAAEMVKRNVVGVDDFRFFDGVCGWEKNQLNDEIRAGYWSVGACSPSVLGLSSFKSFGLWEEVLGLMGPKKVW